MMGEYQKPGPLPTSGLSYHYKIEIGQDLGGLLLQSRNRRRKQPFVGELNSSHVHSLKIYRCRYTCLAVRAFL